MKISDEKLEKALRDKSMDYRELSEQVIHYKVSYRKSLETITHDRKIFFSILTMLCRVDLNDKIETTVACSAVRSLLMSRLWEVDPRLALKDENGDLKSIGNLENGLSALGLPSKHLADRLQEERNRAKYMRMKENETQSKEQ